MKTVKETNAEDKSWSQMFWFIFISFKSGMQNIKIKQIFI